MTTHQIPNELWDRRFLEMAAMVANWSKDPSTGVGAVLVNDRKEVVGLGFNGFPRGVADDARLHDRPVKYEIVVHAEVNACVQAGHRARGCSLYVYYPPMTFPPLCSRCAGVVIQSGVTRVVGYKGEQPDPRWKDSIAMAQGMCLEAGLVLDAYPR